MAFIGKFEHVLAHKSLFLMENVKVVIGKNGWI